MTAHRRQQIRDAAAADLKGLPSTGDRVYSGRAYGLAARRLPALLVYSRREESEVASAGRWDSRSLLRSLQLVVEARAQGEEGALDDALDEIAKEVEQAIALTMVDSGSSLYPLCKRIDLAETEIAVGVEGDRPSGEMVMVFEAVYGSKEADPSQPD